MFSMVDIHPGMPSPSRTQEEKGILLPGAMDPAHLMVVGQKGIGAKTISQALRMDCMVTSPISRWKSGTSDICRKLPR